MQLRLFQKKKDLIIYLKEMLLINLSKFVINHIESGNHIIHDGWSGYSFLDIEDSTWTHEVHYHCGGDYGWGESSTLYIEHAWSQLKFYIKIYMALCY